MRLGYQLLPDGGYPIYIECNLLPLLFSSSKNLLVTVITDPGIAHIRSIRTYLTYLQFFKTNKILFSWVTFERFYINAFGSPPQETK